MLAGLIALIPGAASIATGGWGIALAVLSNQWVRLGVVALAVYVYADVHGRSIANAACHEADVRAQNAVIARDLAIRTQAADDAEKRAADLDQAHAADTEKISALNDALSKKPIAAVCKLDTDGLQRLRSIK